jgi:hypothetical protein
MMGSIFRLVFLISLGSKALAGGFSSIYAPSMNTIPPAGNITNIPMANPSVSPGAFQNGLAMSNYLKNVRPLAGRWGLGVDSVPGITPLAGSGPLIAVPRALDLRYWATDRLGLDLLLAGNYSSQQAGKGALSPLVSSSPGDAVYGGGLAARYNLSEPNRDLLAQLVLRATAAQSVENAGAGGAAANSSTLALFAGAGFEAFVPGWDWLSVEASAGLTGFSESLTPQGGSAGGAQTLSGLALAGSGYSPVNASVHIYF